MDRVCILMPLFNDWASAQILIPRIDKAVAAWQSRVTLVMVDDGSRDPMPEADQLIGDSTHIAEVRVIHLTRNRGHQRAIAVGLAYAHGRGDFSAVYVMDSDGEDPPEELEDLRRAGLQHPEAIITADRASRSEGPLFRLGYRCYRLLFRLLTGVAIRFGNFCRIPAVQLERLVYYADLWNSLSGCIKKSRLPTTGIPSHRAVRYIGPSKMNLMALVLHGLNAVAVFHETALVRMLLIIALAAVVAAVGWVASLFWSTAAAGAAWGLLLAMVLLTGMVLLAVTLAQLQGRSRFKEGPAAFWQSQVRAIRALREPVHQEQRQKS